MYVSNEYAKTINSFSRYPIADGVKTLAGVCFDE